MRSVPAGGRLGPVRYLWEAASNDAQGGQGLLPGGDDVLLVLRQLSHQVVDHSRAHA